MLKSLINNFKKRSKTLSIAMYALLVIGTLMIASASMGEAVGELNVLTNAIKKQAIIVVLSLLLYYVFLFIDFQKLPIYYFTYVYIALVIMLFIPRAFSPVNGAYAWISLGPISFQPSEFCKVFMIVNAARLFDKDYKENNKSIFLFYGGEAIIMVGIIFFVQHDTGSALILAAICYLLMFIPEYKEYKKYDWYMFLGLLIILVLFALSFSPAIMNFIDQHFDGYIWKRITNAANPFKERYDSGYHLVMSLVSFANGGWFGLGYGNSIHKYMNFPNPTNDFILPIIVEEFGIVGFIVIVFLYAIILSILMYYSINSNRYYIKLTLFGTFLYVLLHFILNVGGVSGFIPLTGVPLLLLSSGGSSTMACLIALGISQRQIIKIKKQNTK